MRNALTLPYPETGTTESSARDYWTLLKPGVMMLVVFTGIVGLVRAPGSLHPFLEMLAILSIALGSGAGAIINMWYDRDIDAVMARTRNRPIPAGRIAADDALIFAAMLSLLSVSLLGLATNWLAACMLAFAIAFYGWLYTMHLKRRTPQNIVIGGAAGALPPVIGWLAVSPEMTLEPWLYFLIIFLWTPPHFWALALYRHADYAAAKVPMLPVTHGETATKRHIVAYGWLLVAASLLPFLLASPADLYGASAVILGGVFLMHCHKVQRTSEPRDAIRLFKFSILYLFLLFSALMLDKMIDISIIKSMISSSSI